MPTLPNPEALNRVGFEPSRKVVQADPGIANRLSVGALGQERAATESLVASATGTATRISTAVNKERARLDNLKRDDAENQALAAFTELSLEARKVKLGDTLKPDYITSYAKRFDDKTKAVEDSLNNEEQKQSFRVSRERAQVEFNSGLAKHAMAEADSYRTQVYDTRKETIANFAAAQPTNTDATENALAMLEASVRTRALELGFTDQTGRDKESVENMLLEETGVLHAAVIDAARAQGRVKYAKEYAEANEGHMPPAVFAKVMDRLRPAASVEVGKEVGNAAFAMIESGQFKNVDVEKYIDENTQGDSQATSAARAVVLERRQAAELDARETTGGLMTQFLSAPNPAEARNKLLASEEFISLPSSWKERVMKDMDAQLFTKQNREKKVDAVSWDTEEVNAKYYDIVEDLKDDTKALPSVNQLTALRTEIGPRKVQQLLSLHKERASGTVRFNIASEILNDAIPKPLLSSGKKDQLNAFRGIVESNLADWKADNVGKLPTPDEQRRIARSALTEYEEKGVLWGTNKKPLYEAPPEEREKRRVEASRADWEARMASEAKTRGIVLTKDKINEMWQRKLSKAQK